MPRKRTPSRADAAVLILSAYPRRADAERAARSLVRGRILACATVAGSARAFYRWKGRLRSEGSFLLWGKTTSALANGAVRAIRVSHPDRVPEILVLRVSAGEPRYLRWLRGEVKRA
ncbi:MAG: divalent-cation tolerance protein CutA [Candidatus Latescibacteria bacterium]|nr:divalent-cation tolerance protein CutA [Candidatus Latescibacterota bacterium]